MRSSFARIAQVGVCILSASSGRASAQESSPDESEILDEQSSLPSEDATAPSAAGMAPCPGTPPTTRGHVAFVDGGFRFDSGNFSRTERVGSDTNNQNDAVSTVGPLLELGLLFPFQPHMRMGGALGYGANYDLNGESLLVGQLLTLDYRVEWSVPLVPKVALFGAPRAGLALILPGGILERRIDANQLAGYDTWSGPRYGFLLGVDAGIRYALADWVGLRATVGYGWGMTFLLDSKAEGQSVSASQTWQLQASRVTGAVGVECYF